MEVYYLDKQFVITSYMTCDMYVAGLLHIVIVDHSSVKAWSGCSYMDKGC